MGKGRATPRHKNSKTLLPKPPRIPKLRAFAQPGQRSVAGKIILSKKEKIRRSRAAHRREVRKRMEESGT